LPTSAKYAPTVMGPVVEVQPTSSIAVDTVFAVKSKMTGFGAGANGQRFGL